MTKRILLLIKGLGRGGAEQLLVSAAPHFDRERFAYEVAYLVAEKDALVDSLRSADIPVHLIDGAPGIGWLRSARALVRERRIDLVHSHLPYTGIGARIALAGQVASVYTEHNQWKCYHRSTRLANMLTLPREDHVFAVSDHVRDSMRPPRALAWALRKPPLETLYHGIDPADVEGWTRVDGVRKELGIPDGVPVVGTVANFRAEKGYDRLVRAAAMVHRAEPDVRFVFVGQGPLEPAIRSQVHALGLERVVVFAGYRTDAPRIATAFDVFALASIHEGLSIALIEAMAVGTPAVVTDAGGLPEVVQDGRQGLVVRPDDPKAMAAGILTLVRDDALRKRYGEQAKARAGRFDIRLAVRRMEEVYEELLS